MQQTQSDHLLRNRKVQISAARLRNPQFVPPIAVARVRFAGNREHDAHEFCLELLNQIHDELADQEKVSSGGRIHKGLGHYTPPRLWTMKAKSDDACCKGHPFSSDHIRVDVTTAASLNPSDMRERDSLEAGMGQS